MAPEVTNTVSVAPVFGDDLAILTCEADALPEPTVTWWKDKTSLDKIGKFDVNTSWTGLNVKSVMQFSVEQPSDYGSYTCVIRNAVGTTEVIISLSRSSGFIEL